MFAPLLAVQVCLLSFGPCTAGRDRFPLPITSWCCISATLPTNTAAPVLAMQREVETQIEAAGYHLEWRSLGNPTRR